MAQKPMRSLLLPSLAPAASIAVALALTLATPPARAHSGGFAVMGCAGCHNEGTPPSISLKHTPESPSPGDTVTLDVAIEAINGDFGGLYLLTDGRGQLINIAGQGTHLHDASKLVHSAPKKQTNGAVHFTVSWIAPDTPGGVLLKVWAISANGDQKKSGDGGGSATFSFVYGCSGVTYYADHDGDGHGDASTPVVDCVKPVSYAATSTDCDDTNAKVYTGADELCDGLDNDCDGEADENLEIAPQYEDADGDGHGAYDGDVIMAKCPPFGYAPILGDCDDANPDVHEGAVETCDYIDQDCDARIDEGVRDRCGVGWCERIAESCGEPVLCTPGEPNAETCNLFDDDCDGEVDEGADICEPGTLCKAGTCVPGPPTTKSGGSTCSINTPGASPWGMLALLYPLIAASRRLLRRPSPRS